jgi:signal transduction histidine kinase/ligand-binding sensor domain-containing protein
MPAAALESTTLITQYRHTAWRAQEGAFESAPNAITQTANGYILIGTNSGLVRFDGVRFRPWSPSNKNLSGTAILSLLNASDGTLWIGTPTGLLSFKDDQLRERVSGRIAAIAEDHQKRIWVVRSLAEPTGGLCQVVGDHSDCIRGAARMPLLTATALSEDVEGNLWVGGSNQLLRWRDGDLETYLNELEGSTVSSITSIAAGTDTVWAAIPRKGFGVFRIVNRKPIRAEFSGIDTTRVASLFMDRDRSLWMGTFDDGIYRYHGERVDRFRSEHGLSSNEVRGFFEDLEGNLWVMTSKGLDCLSESSVATFSTTEEIPRGRIGAILAADDGTVWFGHEQNLYALRGNAVTPIQVPGGRSVNALWQDHAKRLWVGLENMLTVYERGRSQEITRLDGSPLGTPIAITEDREHDIWVSVGITSSSDRKLFRIHDLRVQDEFAPDRVPLVRRITADPTGGIWLGFEDGNLGHFQNGKLEISSVPISAKTPAAKSEIRFPGLMVDSDGSAWASTWSGLVRWKNHERKTLTSKNGLPCDAIVSSIRDDQAALWLYTRCGFIAIADSELEKWWQQPDRMVQFQTLEVLDGAALPQGPKRLQPAVSKAPDGRLWFANESVLQVIDPRTLRKNRAAPPVHVEDLRADRKDYAVGGLVQLPARTRDIEIGYTGLSFSIPQKVRFRYKLEGRDPKWRDAGTRRSALYSDLSPGRYRFHVTASNNGGVWNETGAALDFLILPAYYQTTVFRVATVMASLALLWLLYRRHLHQVARQFDARVQERVNERTRIARELHDTLLQSLHGLMFQFQAVRNMLPGRTDEAMKTLDGAIQRTEQAIAESRDAIQDLRSAADQGDLGQALATLGKELTGSEASQDAPTFRVTVEGEVRRLPPILHDEICRIARELLRNAFRHARARRIEVEIRYEESTFLLRIRDDGAGIDPAILRDGGRAGHWGLHGVRERARRIGAQLDFWSESGAGTEIQLEVPAATAYEVAKNEDS